MIVLRNSNRFSNSVIPLAKNFLTRGVPAIDRASIGFSSSKEVNNEISKPEPSGKTRTLSGAPEQIYKSVNNSFYVILYE